MPTLVHIADERNCSKIAKSGISLGKHSKVVYCMPVLQNHFVSHQWLRELKYTGAKTMAGVYFRLSSDEIVLAGKYNEPHVRVRLGDAVKTVMSMKDPLGFELMIERKIDANEITKIRALPQNIGWRYMPNSHERVPCGCVSCQRGRINSFKIRAKSGDVPPLAIDYAAAKREVLAQSDPNMFWDILWKFRMKRRRADPIFLAPLLEFSEPDLLEDLALTLAYFRHENSKEMLLRLCTVGDIAVKETAVGSLLFLYRERTEALLGKLKSDPVITNVLRDTD